MISRPTACAVAFALIGTTAAIAFTAEAQQRPAGPALSGARTTTRIVELPRVVVVGHRLDR